MNTRTEAIESVAWQLAAYDLMAPNVPGFAMLVLKSRAAVAMPVDEPVATKLVTMPFGCFHVSEEDAEKLRALPVGTKLYAAPQPAPTCTCPSGDGSLRHPCPAHPAGVADCLTGEQLYEMVMSGFKNGTFPWSYVSQSGKESWNSVAERLGYRAMLASAPKPEQPTRYLTDFDIVTMANSIIDYYYLGDGNGPAELASDEARQAGIIEFGRAIEAMLARPAVKDSLTAQPGRDHPAGHSDCIVDLLGQSCPECAREGQCGECHAQPPAVPQTGG